MRKDVRIGLSIGGVLLAVLIVYLLVPKDDNTGRSNSGQIARSEGGAPSQGGVSESPAGTGQGGAAAPSQPNPPANQIRGPKPGEPAPATRPGESEPTVDAGSENQTNGGVDWPSILREGVLPPALLGTDRGPAGGPDIFADQPKVNGKADTGGTARNTPGGTVEWPTGTPVAGVTGSGPGTSRGATPSRGGLSEHTVQRGEDYSKIALAVYGDARYWTDIEKANPNLDPSRLRPGTVIKLPDAASVKAAHAPAVAAPQPTPGTGARTEAAIDPAREYRVQPNDSLQKIALKLYGKATKADALYEANKEKIGPDEHRIKVGMVLKLPEPPTVTPTATR